MSSSARFLGTIHGGSFDGGIAWPGDSAPVESARPPGFRDDLAAALFELRVTDPKMKTQLSLLMSERIALNRRTEEFLRAQAAHEKESLAKQHEALKAEIRAVLGEIEKTKTEILRLRGAHTEAKNRTEHFLSELHGRKQERAGLSKYSPTAEIKKADAAVARADKNVRDAQALEAAPLQGANHLSLTVLRDLSEKWRTLEGQEKDLSLILSGQGGTNSLGFLERARV